LVYKNSQKHLTAFEIFGESDKIARKSKKQIAYMYAM
jgi:hypothetical protein